MIRISDVAVLRTVVMEFPRNVLIALKPGALLLYHFLGQTVDILVATGTGDNVDSVATIQRIVDVVPHFPKARKRIGNDYVESLVDFTLDLFEAPFMRVLQLRGIERILAVYTAEIHVRFEVVAPDIPREFLGKSSLAGTGNTANDV